MTHTSFNVQCCKAKEVNFQFCAVVLDTHIKCVDKVQRIDPTLVMLPLN